MRPAPLTTIKGGINRLRTKGAARADVLYDLLNGYVTESGTVKSRPGTERVAQLDSSIRGLCAFDGSLHVFAAESVAVPAGFTLNVLIPPTVDGYDDYDPPEVVPLEKIHFAAPFMGALYVVAEFQDGSIYHYWLQPGATWEPNTMYRYGDLVIPTTPNGIVYRATRFGDPNPVWAPSVPRYDGTNSDYEQSIVEPTVYNDYMYICVETIGDNPTSGTTEPEWPTEDGARIVEESEGEYRAPPSASTPPATNTPQSSLLERYGRLIDGRVVR